MKKIFCVFFLIVAVCFSLAAQSLTTVILPQYIQGNTGTNSNRIPFAYRARITGLTASAMYRYYNQVVISSDPDTISGSGNCIFTSATGDFVRTSSPGLVTAGTYGTLTADGTGAYEGWFITEPTGNKRFVPGQYIFMRISLNDGAGGTNVTTRLTIADSVRVVKLDPTVTDSTGTGLRCASSWGAKDFVFTYADTAGTGRPISGSFIESDGTDNSTANSYAAFYSDSVNGVGGAFGIILPNALPNGIRRIEERSLTTGAVVTSATDIDGVWPSGANTINPSGGTTDIVLASTDLLSYSTSSPAIASVILPQYIQGNTGTNSNRIPFAYRARITGLTASAMYRYYNQVVISSDPDTISGSGNCIFTSATGDFVRTSSPGLVTAGTYGTLTADGTGAYEGWFITEPTGNKRFVPGQYIFMRISLNDGAGGSSVVTRLTTIDSVCVVKLDSVASDSTGTGFRCTGSGNPKNFVFAYDNTSGTGRPISGSFIESDGTANTSANNYTSFYANRVDSVNNAFGMVLPNILPHGIRRIEERSLTTDAVVTSATDTNGVWPSGANTVNPSGGTSEIVLAGTDLLSYSLTLNFSHGTVTKTPDQQNYQFGTSVQLKEKPNNGYHFVTWAGDVPTGHETDTLLTVIMNQNRTITASFALDTSSIAIASVILPQYIEGIGGKSNTNRIPFAYRVRITGLLKNATYRFANQVVLSTDPDSADGAGNCIFASATGNFIRASSPGFESAGSYGILKTDSSGAYDGWFITEPTGNYRFVPGKYIFMRIGLNDGMSGTNVVKHVTLHDSVRVVKLDPSVTDSTGTGLRCTSVANSKDFVFIYDNKAGTGRPISGSFIENDGTDNSIANNYAAFYANHVDGIDGSFGVVLPNILPNGVRRIERRSLATGAIVVFATDADGVWPSGVNTINPSGGTTELVLSGTDVQWTTGVQNTNMIPENFALSQNYPNPFNPSTTIKYQLPQMSYVTLRVYDILGREVTTLVNETKQTGYYSVEFNAASLSSGIYFYKITAGSLTISKQMILVK